MADLISREALLKEVESRIMWSLSYNALYEAIQEAPAVDAVEVVRCKDCKWSFPTFDGRIYCRAERNVNFVSGNHFCSFAERREENATD